MGCYTRGNDSIIWRRIKTKKINNFGKKRRDFN